jgi:hypothetical protein
MIWFIKNWKYFLWRKFLLDFESYKVDFNKNDIFLWYSIDIKENDNKKINFD